MVNYFTVYTLCFSNNPANSWWLRVLAWLIFKVLTMLSIMWPIFKLQHTILLDEVCNGAPLHTSSRSVNFKFIQELCLQFTDCWQVTGHYLHCTCGIRTDFEVFEELVDLHSMQGQTKGSVFTQALLCSLQKHNSKLSKLVSIGTDYVPFIIGPKNGMVSLLYKHMLELGLQNGLI